MNLKANFSSQFFIIIIYINFLFQVTFINNYQEDKDGIEMFLFIIHIFGLLLQYVSIIF